VFAAVVTAPVIADSKRSLRHHTHLTQRIWCMPASSGWGRKSWHALTSSIQGLTVHVGHESDCQDKL
jgi:hypothetical protein